MKKLIRLKHGRVLEFSQERNNELVYFNLKFRKACAAYAKCRIDSDVLVLVDIFVEDRCVVRQPNILRYLLGQKTLEVNFRNQGIGSQLLATIIAYANSKRLKRIVGQMVEKDLEPNPKLPQWYENRGFSVSKNELFIDLVKAPANDTRYMPKS